MKNLYALLFLTFFIVSSVMILPLSETNGQKLTKYSFTEEPYINPKIIQDMISWLSDSGDQIVSINLYDAQNSNRYFATTKTKKIRDNYPFIYYHEDNESFGYQYVGELKNQNIHVLKITDNVSGSGVFKTLLLVKLLEDKGIIFDEGKNVIKMKKNRRLIKKIGQLSLGDRYSGNIHIEDDRIVIKKDKGQYSHNKKDKFIKVQ